jgi:tetratricopeptide (TPR) repeat protein
MALLPSGKVIAHMPKTGRNDPCPCGSGQKYKRCCLQKDQAAEHAAHALTATAKAEQHKELDTFLEREEALLLREEELTQASNAAVDLVQAGSLDEAERAARDLLVRFPDVHDGYDRLGMVYEARGDRQKAVECYRKVIELIRADPERYHPDFEATVQRLIDKLDTPPADIHPALSATSKNGT